MSCERRADGQKKRGKRNEWRNSRAGEEEGEGGGTRKRKINGGVKREREEAKQSKAILFCSPVLRIDRALAPLVE